MSSEFKKIPDWNFIIDEVSNGVYKISGKDKSGHNIELIGTDIDALLDNCKKYAESIMSNKNK